MNDIQSLTTDIAFIEITEALLREEKCEFRRFVQALQHYVRCASANDPHRLRVFIRHLVFLLKNGKSLFAACEFVKDSHMQAVLIVERTARDENDLVMKTHVRLSLHPLPLDPRAFTAYGGKPNITVYHDRIRLVDRWQETGVDIKATPLAETELDAFFANKQNIVDRIQTAAETLDSQTREVLARQSTEDRIHIAQAFETVQRIGDAKKHATTPLPSLDIRRSSHPCRGAALHILPRLLLSSSGRGPLGIIADELEAIRNLGFAHVVLGVVDPQSTQLYYGESEDGLLTPYVNNHGYWSAGQPGVDPALGRPEDYAALAARTQKLGMTLIQDCTFGTLGYPPQLARFAPDESITSPLTLNVAGHDVMVSDPVFFLHDLCIPEEHGLGEGVTTERYTEVIAQTHLGSPFALPKPNLFDATVREALLARARWQIEHGGITAFRIDMAKHIGIRPLQSLLDSLRWTVEDFGGEFWALLEYWSVRYRDLKFALTALEEQKDHVYAYDFPLAHALQCIFLHNKDWSLTLHELMQERARWDIDPCMLIPVFIDHDFNFRPIYNGSRSTRDTVVAGLSMAFAVSANGPSAFFGYDNRQCGPPDPSLYFEYSEQFSRKHTSRVIADDSDSPAGPFAALMTTLRNLRFPACWDGEHPHIEGDDQRIAITRGTREGTCSRRIRFCFARGDDAESMGSAEEERAFSSGAGPSIAVFIL